jgi:hypothetical protein
MTFWSFSQVSRTPEESAREANWWLSSWWTRQLGISTREFADDLLNAPYLDHERAAGLLTALDRRPHEGFGSLRTFSRSIRRLPDDLLDTAAEIGLQHPTVLYDVARALRVDPVKLTPFAGYLVRLGQRTLPVPREELAWAIESIERVIGQVMRNRGLRSLLDAYDYMYQQAARNR